MSRSFARRRSSAPAFQPVDEAELLPAAMGGDRRAFTELLEANLPRLHGLAMRMSGDEQIAHDALQDASLAAWRHLPGFRGNSAFSTWIYRITVNATLRRMRKRREHPVGDSLELIAGMSRVEGPAVSETEWPLQADDVLERQQIRRSVLDAMETLPPKYNEMFELRDLRGLSLQEIADVTGLSIPAVKTRVHRARRQMRQAMTGRAAPNAPRPTSL